MAGIQEKRPHRHLRQGEDELMSDPLNRPNLPQVPPSIPRSKLEAFLHDLGLDVSGRLR
jgi:hypothetical protein